MVPVIERPPKASLGALARAWAVIGSQSVGGGASTLFLMRRELVDRRGWLSARDFLEDWALCKLSPGINLIALTALVGTRLAGTRGLVVSVVAMLLPAGVITAAMTAGYGEARDHPLVAAAFAGAGPVSAGMAGGLAIAFARPAVRRGGRAPADWTYQALVVAAGLFTGVHTLAVIGVGLAFGGLFMRGETTRASGDPGT